MYSRHFGSEKIVCTFVRPPVHVSRGEILHFKHPHVSAVNRMATRTFREEKNSKTKLILSFDSILMSILTWIAEKELERGIKQIRRKKNMKIFYRGSEKMRNASGHQGENER